MERLKMHYNASDFADNDDAWSDFEKRWAENNPSVARDMDIGDLPKAYQGAHYRKGKWFLCSEVRDFRKSLESEEERARAGEPVTRCPVCHKGGVIRPASWPAKSVCVHILAKENGEEVIIFAHPVMPAPAGAIVDYST